MEPDAMILVFWMLSFKPAFSLSSFAFIKRLFGSSSLSAIRVVSSAYLRLLIFLPAILIPASARVNVDILGISELNWTGMGEFNSDDHYIYYCGHESLRRNGVAIMVNRVQNAVLGYNLKNDRMISLHFQGKPFNITVIQAYAPTNNAEEAEVEWFYEDLQDFLELTPKKRCPFHYRGLECKSRKLRNTWSNRQIWLWLTEWERAKANEVLPRERTGHNKHSLPTHKRRLYTWTSLEGQHRNQIDYILCSQRWRSSIQSAKTRPGADCGSDHELLIAKCRLKLKKD